LLHQASGLSHTDAIAATMKELNLSKASVTSYLPYEKGVYFPQKTDRANLSVGAERVRRMRKRKRVLENLLAELSEEALWEAVIEFQGYKFRTYSGLPFSYKLKKGRSGAYTKELFIDRRESSKSLTWSSVLLAFGRIHEVGAVVNQCHLVKQDMLENPCHKTALYWNDMGILPAVRSSITGYVVQWEVFGYGKQTDCISALKMVYC
jgi:hypothetical protein